MSLTKQNILLDMDGVLADFAGSAIRLLNEKLKKDHTIEQYASEYGEFGMDKFYGISEEEFWSVIDYDEYFWYNIEPLPWAKELYGMLLGFGEVMIVTSPAQNPVCAYHKYRWLYEHLNIKTENIILCSKKHLLAGNGLLIDDYKKNVIEFMNAGGDAVCVPSNWNTPNLDKYEVFDTILDALTFETI